MRICVVGAGAIGGFLAARLAHAGHNVSVVARGATLATIRARGLTLHSRGQTVVASVRASAEPRDFGHQDVVIFAVKSPALPAAAEQARALIGPDTIVVPALNGLPWWFFLTTTGKLGGTRLESVDPDRRGEAVIPSGQVVGCVVFPACSSPEPGVVIHASGDRVVFGEPSGGISARAETLADAFRNSGLDSEASQNIRKDVWLKLLGNLCFNPVSLLAGCSTDRLIDDPRVHALFAGMMAEAIGLGRQIGIDVEIVPDQRIALTRKLGQVKTSMLQDVEARRPVEIEAILGSVISVAEAANCEVPLLKAVYALARIRATTLGLLPQ